MSSPWTADYSRVYLLPRAVDEWVGPDDPVRFIRSFVERYSESKWKLPKDCGGPGRPAYDGEVLLKIWIYAYIRGMHSSRAVERGCREWVPLMWLAGELKPDHNTLWRFWAANQEAIGQLFELTMEMARELGLIGLALHAVDGTKIQACGSTHGRSFSASEAERLSEELQDRKKPEQWIDRAIANA